MKTELYKDAVIPEGCTKAVLSNSLTVFITEKPEFSSSFAIFGTHYGSVDTKFSKDGEEMISVPEGIAHYLEHKLFESEDGDAFQKYAKTGASANAFTSFDRTCYLFSCSSKFEENLGILLDFVQSPYFTKETVQKEQGIIGQEIRMYDDSPQWCVMFNMLSGMYQNHPVKIDIAGTVESIAKITPELLYSCYNTFYNPANMFVCIAGNVDRNAVLKQIEDGIKKTKPVKITRGGFSEPDGIVNGYIEKKMAVSLPLFCIGYKENADKERTVKETVAEEILLDIIAGDISPLYKELINDGLLTDSFDSEYFQGFGYATPIFQGESVNPKAVADRLNMKIAEIKKDGIDLELFNAAKKSMYGSLIKRYNTSEGTVMSLVDCAMTGDGPFDDLDAIRSITVDEVYERLMLWKEENMVLSVIKPITEDK